MPDVTFDRFQDDSRRATRRGAGPGDAGGVLRRGSQRGLARPRGADHGLEEEYQLEISDEDAERIGTVGQAWDYIKEKSGAES